MFRLASSRAVQFGAAVRAYSTAQRYDVLIVGGGSAGMGLAANWLKHNSAAMRESGEQLSFGIVEPSSKHYYQPLWTLVGGNVPGVTAEQSSADTASLVPKGAELVVDRVSTISPETNQVTLESGKTLGYNVLVMAAGLQVNFDKIPGLVDAIVDPDSPVCSNYSYDYCQKTSRLVKEFEGGDAYFTFPTGPVKCAGAPQKIMYLAHSAWQSKALETNIHYYSAIGKLFAIDKYRVALEKLCQEKGITRQHGYNLVEVRPDAREAVFQTVPDIVPGEQQQVTVNYDFLHAVPPMSAPDFVRESPLVDASGFVNVNKETLQHVQYPNVFALGDCSNLPTSKTMAAVASQLAVVRYRAGKVLRTREVAQYRAEKLYFAHFVENDGPIYDGYTSCPLPVGDNKGIIAEFNYDAQPQETLPWDQSQPSLTNFMLKSYVLPALYWQAYLKGDWEGPWAARKLLNFLDKEVKSPRVIKQAAQQASE